MKKIISLFIIFCSVLYSCNNTEVEGVDLDFEIDAPVQETKGYVGKPITLSFKVQKTDANNNYPMQFKITTKSGKVLYSDTDTLLLKKDVFQDMKTPALSISYIPTETTDEEFTITIKNQLVEKQETVLIDVTSNYYTVYAENFSEKPLIDKRLTFDLVIKEAEETAGDSIISYAKVVQGTGEVYNGEVQLNNEQEIGKTRLLTGTNKIIFLPRTEGENIIRFFFINKWNNETYVDVKTNISLPQWNIETESDTIYVPINDKTSFALNIKEADIFEENEYKATYKMSSELQDFNLNINNADVKMGAEFTMKNGSNVAIMTSKEEATGVMDLYIKDKYKQEHTKRLVFLVKLPTKPLVAALDQTSIQIHENEKATFKLSVSEANYKGTFKVKIHNITGDGTFTTDKDMVVSAGTHEIGYIPASTGTHTFSITITDDNGQKKELNATVQTEKNPLITLLAQTGGAVSGGGSKIYGTQVAIAAVPLTGYTFTGWYEDNKQITTNTAYTFTATKDRTFEARFAVSKFTVTLSAQTGGKVQGSGAFEYNKQITVKAIAEDGYSFTGWFDGDVQLSTSPDYQFSVTKNISLEARFSKEKLSLTVNATAGGSASGSGSYDYGTTVELKATPLAGYSFVGWFEDGKNIGSALTLSYKVIKSASIEARFGKGSHTVSLTAQAGGTVTGGGTFEHNEQVTITATPQAGYTFSGWYENNTLVSPSQTYVFNVTATRNLQARFTEIKYNIVVNAGAGGAVAGSGTYTHNAQISIAASPITGYQFEGWYENGAKVSSNSTWTFTATKDRILEAKFTKAKYTVSLTAQTGGTTAGAGTFEYNEQVTITATPQAGYTFSGWYENNTLVSPSQTYVFNVTATRNLQARFTEIKYNIVVNAGAGGAVAGSGTYTHNAQVTLKATASTGYDFSGWYENGVQVSTNSTWTFTATKDRTLEAKFTTKKYTITLSGVNGTQAGSGSFDYNTNATIKATPNANYTFTGWYENNGQVSTSNPYTFKVEKDRIIEAKYQLVKRTLTLTAGTGGAVSGAGNFDHGASVTVVASPNTNYKFEGWYNGATKVSSNISYTFTITSNITLTAKFTLDTFKVTVSSGTGGAVTGGGIFAYNSQITLTAIPNTGYMIEGWYSGTTKVSSNLNYVVVVKENINYEARFKISEEKTGFQGSMIWSGPGGYGVDVKGYHPTYVKKNTTTRFTWDQPNNGISNVKVQTKEGTGTVKIENNRDIVVTPTSTGNFKFILHSNTQSNPNVEINLKVID